MQNIEMIYVFYLYENKLNFILYNNINSKLGKENE